MAGQAWAEDWALFAALSEEARGGWWSWEDRALANRDPDAMAAARAAVTPATLSSTTRQSAGAVPMARAACRNRSGAGLPRGTARALKMCGSK